MGSDIPVLKAEVPMALPGEGQPLLDQSSKKLYEEASASVLKIVTDRDRSGSGFVAGDKNTVVTSARAIMGSKEQFAIASDGKKYKLELFKLDDMADLALLKIKDGSIPNAKVLPLGDTDSLDKDHRVLALSHPQAAESSKAYASPGYIRGLSSPLNLIMQTSPQALKILEMNLSIMGVEDGKKASDFLSQALIETKMHVEIGSGGSPVLDSSGNVIGITSMTNAREIRSGQTLVGPVDNLQKMLAENGEFKFTYKARGADWAEKFMNDWQQDKTKAALNSAAIVFAGGLGAKAAFRYPQLASAGVALYGFTKIGSDAQKLLQSTDKIDTLKYGLASAADLGTLGGAAMTMMPRLRGYGVALALAGIAGRQASDFIKNRWVLEKTESQDGSPARTPFNLEDLLKPPQMELMKPFHLQIPEEFLPENQNEQVPDKDVPEKDRDEAAKNQDRLPGLPKKK